MTAIIPINDKYRIEADEYLWAVSTYAPRKNKSREQWEHVSCHKTLLQAAEDVRKRTIFEGESYVIDEVIQAISASNDLISSSIRNARIPNDWSKAKDFYSSSIRQEKNDVVTASIDYFTIPINDRYAIELDTHSWAVCVPTCRSDKTRKQWKQIAWFATLEQATENVRTRYISASEAKDIDDVISAISAVTALILKAIRLAVSSTVSVEDEHLTDR